VPRFDLNGVSDGYSLGWPQRDEVYQYLLVDVGGITDMTTLIRDDGLVLARRLRARFEENMRLLDQIGWEPKGEKSVYAITLGSEDIRTVFRRLLGHALHLIDAPGAKSAQVLRQAASVAEIASVVLNELPGGTREPQP
jgi:hypothetical protein